MEARRINNWVYIFILLCSTSFYKFSALGRIQEVGELAGVIMIIALLVLHLVYSEKNSVKRNYSIPVLLILFSLIGSSYMAYFSRDQPFGQTLIAQRAIYYYAFYFLLHQLRISPKDLERIWITMGIIYVILFLVQYTIFPTIIFDAYVRSNRGTIRIYLPGSVYLMISFFFSAQYFFRTNRIKYLVLLLLILVIYILTGGRQILATVVLVLIMFLVFDRKIKSRVFLVMLGLIGLFAAFVLFQGIFEGIMKESRSDLSLGEEYVRLRASEFYLTDFFKSPFAYITGNGMYFSTSDYGREISYNMRIRRYVLGDVGLIGNYAIYGAFFVMGVLSILYKSLIGRIEQKYSYIKLMFIAMLISIVIAGGFAQSDTIFFVVSMLYVIDVSKLSASKSSIVEKEKNT